MIRKMVKVAVILTFFTTLLPGCTSPAPVTDIPPTALPAPTVTSIPSPTPLPTPTPLPATRLDIGIAGTSLEPGILAYLMNPHPSYGDSLFQASAHPGLFKLDPATGNLQPVIAINPLADWTSDQARMTRIVTIHSDLAWSNGSKLTADDVVFSFELLKKRRAWILEPILT